MKYSLLLLSFYLIACQKNTNPQPPAPGNTEKTMLDVAYGADAKQKMDIYLPANRSAASTKAIVMIHGGAWATGDKSEFNQYVDSLKKRMPNYAIFNINYRLFTGVANSFPAQENDVKAALESIFSKKTEYAISDKIALLGASAGGHLTLLQGYKHASPVKPKVIVDFFGPTNMTELYNNPASPSIPAAAVAQIMGGTPTSNPAIYQQSSPINFVTSQSPPTIILHGGLDPLVAPSQSTALRDKLQLSGVPTEYVFYPSEGHSWVGPNLFDSFNKVQAFLTTHLQ